MFPEPRRIMGATQTVSLMTLTAPTLAMPPIFWTLRSRMAFSDVIGVGLKQAQILNAVITRVSVDVMNHFLAEKHSADVIRHDQSMLAHISLNVCHWVSSTNLLPNIAATLNHPAFPRCTFVHRVFCDHYSSASMGAAAKCEGFQLPTLPIHWFITHSARHQSTSLSRHNGIVFTGTHSMQGMEA